MPNTALGVILLKEKIYTPLFSYRPLQPPISTHKFSLSLSLSLVQERSDVAQKIIRAARKKRGDMIRGIERLCDAYITLAYMDANKHKTEKSK